MARPHCDRCVTFTDSVRCGCCAHVSPFVSAAPDPPSEEGVTPFTPAVIGVFALAAAYVTAALASAAFTFFR